MKPCGVPGSGHDGCALAFDFAEHPARVYPVNYNRPPPKQPGPDIRQPEPNRRQPAGLVPNRAAEQFDNCIRELPILVVKPRSQRYIVVSTTTDFMYSQRFYPSVGEMFIRNADGSIRTTIKDFLADISRGNVEMAPLAVHRPVLESGGDGGDVNFASGSGYVVGSPGMMIGTPGI